MKRTAVLLAFWVLMGAAAGAAWHHPLSYDGGGYWDTRVEIEVEQAADKELMLLGLDAEEARERVERFLDRSHASGVGAVRIVHGHGTGTLRRMVTEVLRCHPAVTSFAHAPRNRGGTGATEVTLEQ